MELRKFEFELTSEECEHVYQVLHGLLTKNMMSIIDVMSEDKSEHVKSAEIRWYVDNTEWFSSIMKKMGFDPNFDETINRLRVHHNLTIVEPDTTASQPVNPVCGAG